MSDGAVSWAVAQVGGRPVHVRTRPWAEVWRVETGAGPWWLKINFAETVYEPRLIGVLATLGSGLLPEVRVHPSQPWSLIADAGRSARDQLAASSLEERVAFWCRLLPAYAELQQRATALELLDVGVPDFAPARLLESFDALLADQQWFDDGEVQQVAAVRSRLDTAARRLADGFPSTVQHDDLHDGNVFGTATAPLIIDWGDAVLAHPFGTLLVTLRSVAASLHLNPSDVRLAPLTAAYLEPWRVGGESDVALREQVDLAVVTGGLIRAAGWRRALADRATAEEYDGADSVSGWMLELVEALDAS